MLLLKGHEAKYLARVILIQSMKICQYFCTLFLDNNYIFSSFLVFFSLPEKATFRRSQHSLCLSFFVTAFLSLSSSVCVWGGGCQTVLLFKNAIFSSQVFLSLNQCKKEHLVVNMAKKSMRSLILEL